MFTSFCKDIYQMLCKRHPNKNIYLISDQHFFHSSIIKYTRNNFSNILEMNQYIIDIHNDTVGKDDIVIFLGDFCFKNSSIKEVLNKLNGYKYLILGNHDSENMIKNYHNLGFESIFTTPIKLKEDYLSHEPLVDDERTDLQFHIILNEFKRQSKGINYHGHIHTKDSFNSETYKNVTCEALDYKPIMIGKTEDLYNKEDKELFINSPYFDEILTTIADKHNINPEILLSDYIYSTMLETFSKYQDKYVVQGSFGLFKKYNFLSKFSDLDISFLYDHLISKSKNYAYLKNMVDESYEDLKQIDDINLRFLRRYSSLRIYEALYNSKDYVFAKCNLDANLISINCYKEKDFLQLEGISAIQKYLMKYNSSLENEYQFPHFKANFLTPDADIANLLLQSLFQKGYEEKRILALKKLQYVYNHSFKGKYIENFEDIFTRFFLRNISLLYTMNRFDEIEYIRHNYNFSSVMTRLAPNFKEQVNDIFNPNSKFFDIYNEISAVTSKDAFQKCSNIMKKIKSKY